MSKALYILDEPLPLSQDFKSLKREGLSYIQQFSENTWTNLNPSDPGVTILDQVCFALTELGYCNDFSMKDILTNDRHELQVNNQFYLPQDILTTAPVTINDYRKYVIDGVNGVDNLLIMPFAKGIYQVYLLIEATLTSFAAINTICTETFFYLNKSRNLGEIFLMPSAFESIPCLLKGTITIEDEAKVYQVLQQVQNQVRNYIFPKVIQSGYQQLTDKNIAVNEIFNGPLLQQGWIEDSALAEKRERVNTMELTPQIASVPGVNEVSGLGFIKAGQMCEEVDTENQPGYIIGFNVLQSFKDGQLVVMCKGRQITDELNLTANASLSKTSVASSNILFGAAVDIQTELPKGKYRDINSYYSIQNTFPEIFTVGADSTIANASDFQVAQSRQLKGYLTLFDQVLANQFSQLANINKLFSFKNTSTGTPSDRLEYYKKQDHFEQHHEYPVPYRVFSPTYFYQSLYEVPHIQPLLKDKNTFDFSIEEESGKELAEQSWQDYKLDPYNPYIHGLMEYIEDESRSLSRRNDLLNHLLARHGESPLVIDAIIEGSSYAAETLKDQVIFKSLYLQNLGLISYFRQKAYNFMGTIKLNTALPDVPEKLDPQILGGDVADFIFNSEKIDRLEKLSKSDFNKYSGLELTLNLLFGLRAPYRDFILDNNEAKENTQQVKQALWMISERRGVILIETALFRQYIDTAPGLAPPHLDNRLVLVLPDYIPALNTPAFKQRLGLFLQNTLPVQLSCQLCFVNESQLGLLIPAFANWHNALLYKDEQHIHHPGLLGFQNTLASLIPPVKTT